MFGLGFLGGWLCWVFGWFCVVVGLFGDLGCLECFLLFKCLDG